ncbi:MAG: RNA-binding protein [Velocimicrobium sp.]
MNQEKEEEIFCKRLKELAHQAYSQGICSYTSFLNLNELHLFYKVVSTIPHISYQIFGGYKEAERRVICFYDDDSFTNVSVPIVCLSILPNSLKYSESLSHRDYLGAILNLGIDRSKVGDILVQGKKAYLFCRKEIAPFICESLERIKHTNVTAQLIDFQEFEFEPETETISGTVTSVRLDRLLSLAFQSSRSSLTSLISAGKVFVNGKMILSNSFVPNEDDIISVRGMGRFVFKKIESQTKKDRYRIIIEKYK